MDDKHNEKEPEGDFWQHLGWLVAFAIAGLFFIFVVTQSDSLRQMACAPREKSCFREWVAALSGWAAVVAAAVTVYFLRKQIDAANKHQRENVELTILNRLALARQYRSALTFACHHLSMIETDFESAASFDARDGFAVERRMASVMKLLETPTASTFDTEIGSTLSSATAVEQLRRTLDWIRERRQILREKRELMAQHEFTQITLQIDRSVQYATAYCNDALETAVNFLAKWEARIASV